MPSEDDDRPRKKIRHEIGQDLSLLSLEELTERIARVVEAQEALSVKDLKVDGGDGSPVRAVALEL